MSRYALLSVSDKRGIVDFANGLINLGYKIISTGGTANELRDANILVEEVSDFTGFPEILDGRVKTLNPLVHGGILSIRTDEKHKETVKKFNIKNIEIVAVNLYPFERTILKENSSFEEAIENIDIGGPAMVRSAAKNHAFVTVVVHPDDYPEIISQLGQEGGMSANKRAELAAKAFAHTALYDSVISGYFNRRLGIEFPKEYTFGGRLIQNMRYGENPHQSAAFYKFPLTLGSGVASMKQLQGKELSFNNIVDINAALELVKEFTVPAAVVIKHTNPCGAAVAEDIFEAYENALACDPESAFGGIVALNRNVDESLAKKLMENFLEVVVAPAFSKQALNLLASKKNLRLMVLEDKSCFRSSAEEKNIEIKNVTGGFLVQDVDNHYIDNFQDLNCPTLRKPNKEEYSDLRFAWAVVKHVKSNAIVYAVGGRAVGIGAGQMSRVDSCKIASLKSKQPLKGCVMASDAFFPFRDSIDEAAKQGITAVISPGGSIRDSEVIQAADEAGIAMIFTGIRHFKH